MHMYFLKKLPLKTTITTLMYVLIAHCKTYTKWLWIHLLQGTNEWQVTACLCADNFLPRINVLQNPVIFSFQQQFTPTRTHSISGIKSQVLTFDVKLMMKNGLEFFILKFSEPLQSCCCSIQKNLPIKAELPSQVSRYLWRGSLNFKI